MKIETVTIHHPELLAESEVPASTVDGWVAAGWFPGPFPTVADDPPPRSGKGSDFASWLDYAARREIIVETGATRDDIIAAVDAVDAQLLARQVGGPDSPVGELSTAPEEDPS